MAQDPRLEVARAAERIDQPAVAIFCHGIDRQVATAEIVFDRHLFGRVERKAVVTGGSFALGAGERVFLAGVRVQEYREIAADAFVSLGFERAGRCADHTPVPFRHGQAQQFIANRATDEVNLHPAILARIVHEYARVLA